MSTLAHTLQRFRKADGNDDKEKGKEPIKECGRFGLITFVADCEVRRVILTEKEKARVLSELLQHGVVGVRSAKVVELLQRGITGRGSLQLDHIAYADLPR